MNLKELREKIARQVKLMQDFLKDHPTFSDEDKTAYEKMNADLAPMLDQKQRLETLAPLEQQYTIPETNVREPERAAEPVNIKEAFSRYIKGEKLLDKERAECVRIHKEAFMAYIAGNVPELIAYSHRQDAVTPKEIQALLSSDQTLGGFLVYDDIRNEIIKAEAGYAVLAPLVRVEPTSSSALVMPKIVPHTTDARRTSGFGGRFGREAETTGGTAPTTQNQPTFGRERIPVNDWVPYAIELTTNLLDDAGANIEGLIADAIGECLAFDKDDAILNGGGDANNEPEGVLQAGISTVNSGGATSIVIGGILGIFSEVPSQYRMKSTWVMASRTMGSILQLNTGTGGVYLFPPNQWNDTILGRPVKFMDYGMDTATAAGGTTFTAGQKPIIFGDFKRYIIAQRSALRIQRLLERFAPNIALLPSARFGGHVVLTNAFRIMRIAA